MSAEKEVWRLVLPYNLLSLMVANDPNWKTGNIQGTGSFSGDVTRRKTTYGRIEEAARTKFVLDYRGEFGDKPIKEILEKTNEETGIEEIAISSLHYIDAVDGVPYGISLNAETAHSGMYKKIVVDGTFPKEGMYRLMQTVKERLKQRTDVNQEFLKHWMPTFLQSKIKPEEAEEDYDLVIALRRDYMLVIKETAKGWTLHDYDYKAKGGIK